MPSRGEKTNGGEGGILNMVARACLALLRLAVLKSIKPQKTFDLGPYFALCSKELRASETQPIRRNSVARSSTLFPECKS
jgi:hypothetical protein